VIYLIALTPLRRRHAARKARCNSRQQVCQVSRADVKPELLKLSELCEAVAPRPLMAEAVPPLNPAISVGVARRPVFSGNFTDYPPSRWMEVAARMRDWHHPPLGGTTKLNAKQNAARRVVSAAESRAKTAFARFEREATEANSETMKQAINGWVGAIEAWSEAWTPTTVPSTKS
jgi:hypothetical protein